MIQKNLRPKTTSCLPSFPTPLQRGDGKTFSFGRCFFIVCFQKNPERPFEIMYFASLILQKKNGHESQRIRIESGIRDTNPDTNPFFLLNEYESGYESNFAKRIRIRIRIPIFLLNEYESGYESNFGSKKRIRWIRWDSCAFFFLILYKKTDRNPNESVLNPGFGIRIQFCGRK